MQTQEFRSYLKQLVEEFEAFFIWFHIHPIKILFQINDLSSSIRSSADLA